MALDLHSQSMRSEPSEWEHSECWLRNARAVGESRAGHHTRPCQGSVRAIPDSIQLGQEQTFALSLPHLCEIPSGSRGCHGQVLAGHSHFTGRSKRTEGGQDPPVSLGLARAEWAPLWDVPPFPGCVQCTPDRKKLPEELKTIQNISWIPLPPSVPESPH